jgi:hypothetical protein
MEPWIVFREFVLWNRNRHFSSDGTGCGINRFGSTTLLLRYRKSQYGITQKFGDFFNNRRFYGRITDLIYADNGSEDLDPKVCFEKRSLVLWIRNDFIRIRVLPY